MKGRTDKLPRCGVLMKNAKEPCARAVGHVAGYGGGHRTRWALDNQYRATLGRDPDAYVYRAGEWVLR